MCVEEENNVFLAKNLQMREREKPQNTIALALEGLWRSPNTIFWLMDNSTPETLPISVHLLLKAA